MKTLRIPLRLGSVGWRRAFWPLLFTVLAGVAITLVVFRQFRAAQVARFRSDFNEDARAKFALVRHQAEAGLMLAQALGRFLEGVPQPDAAGFYSFAHAFSIQTHGLQALEWAPRVLPNERAAFEEAIRREQISNFQLSALNAQGRLVPQGPRPVYYPVLYAEPMNGQDSVVGLDLASDPAALAALDRARDSGEPAVSGPIRPTPAAGGLNTVLVFVPVYGRDMLTDTIERRRTALTGFAVAVLRPEALISSALRHWEPRGLSLDLLDLSAPPGEQGLYHQGAPGPPARAWKAWLFPAPPRAVRSFSFADRQWSALATAGPAYLSQRFRTSFWLTLPVGVLLTGLLALYLGSVLSAHDRLRTLVHKRTAELYESRQLLRLILDAIPVGVHWKDCDSVYLGCNRRVARDAGLELPEHIAGKTDFDFKWNGQAEVMRSRDRQVAQSGQPVLDYDQTAIAADGRQVLLRQSKLPLREPAGRIIGVLTVYEDITERSRAEQALRESEARYRTVVEYSPDGVAVSMEERLVYVNPAAVRLVGGKDAEDLLGRHVLEFIPEEFRPQIMHRRALMDQTGLPVPLVEGKLQRLDGVAFDSESMAAPIVFAGKPAILNTFRDITEQKRQAGAVRSILQATSGSGQDFLTGLVAELARILGVTYAFVGARQPGLPARIRTVALWARGALAPNCEYPLEGTPCANVVGKQLCHYPAQVGRQFPADRMLGEMGAESYLGIPLFSASGAPLGLLCVIDQRPMPSSDLAVRLMRIFADRAAAELERLQTEQGRKRAEAELRRARDELEERVRERTADLQNANERLQELDRLKSQFLAIISHELRTPLNSILGFTGILRQGSAGVLNDQQRTHLGLVSNSAKHLLSIINDLLDLSSIEAGRMEIEHRPFNFADIVSDVVQLLTPLANQKRLALLASLRSPSIPMVGDRKRCFQVLLNLANNAIKFTHHGQVELKAGAEAGRLHVCVADTGIGIRPDQKPLLFEAFRQLDGSAKRLYEGTGLGLYLVRKLLALMHGEITVQSQPGEGSQFTFTLPLRLAAAEPAAAAA